jgi:two-component system, NarL family, invasion response regulator UvrY
MASFAKQRLVRPLVRPIAALVPLIYMPVLSPASPAFLDEDFVVQSWRILVLKSDRLYLETVRGWLREAFPASVIKGVSSLVEAQVVLTEGPVDLLLSGLTAIGDDPIAVLREWRIQGRVRRILLASGNKKPQVLLDALALPVEGFFDAQYEGFVALVVAVRQVMSGKKYLSPSTAEVLAKLSMEGGRLDRMLTAAERRVFAVIGGEGLDDNEAGERLKLSQHTVRKHRESLHRKLKVSTRQELVKIAASWGLVRLGSRVPFRGKA